MLPFLRNRQEASASGQVETKEREHDEDFDMLQAVADDFLEAAKTGDRRLLRDALEALVEHIMDIDAKQDSLEKGV